MPQPFLLLRKLEKAVAVSGVFAGVREESSGKVPGNNPEVRDAIPVRTETIIELILERASPVVFESFSTEINNFQTDSSKLSCKKNEA